MDTADVYSQGESEQVVGRALRGRRDDVFLATKFHGQMSANPGHSGNSRRWIMQSVEGSLHRLQTDRIDLYQAHRPDYSSTAWACWPTAHPAVSSVIIGPRTEDHLKATDTLLGESVLDAIDELVPPGTNFVERDAGARVPSLEYAELRRR
ncbi:aryl-alcohol dehydrogenase-like predicted oxidoreductase [Arthrobacter sp. UYNi723]